MCAVEMNEEQNSLRSEAHVMFGGSETECGRDRRCKHKKVGQPVTVGYDLSAKELEMKEILMTYPATSSGRIKEH